MEREFKWKANAKDFESILRYLNLSEIAPLEMRADYYDTVSYTHLDQCVGTRVV